MNTQVAEIVEEETPAPSESEAQAAIDSANGNEVSTESDDSSSDEANAWSDMEASMDDDDDDLPDLDVDEEPAPALVEESTSSAEVEGVPVTPTAEETKTEVVAPVIEPVAEIAPVEVATPQQETPPQVVAPVEQIPPQPQITHEEAKRQQQEKRALAVDGLAKHYSLSDEDATTLLTDPGAIMPKLRAEMFMDTFDAVMNGVVKSIPNILQNMAVQTNARDTAEAGFYEANPLLDRTRDANIVNRYAQSYLSVNPQATPAQMTKDVGVQVMYALGINPTPVATSPQAAPVAAPAPYVPAGAGGAPSSSSTPRTKGVWGDIADEMMEEEE